MIRRGVRPRIRVGLPRPARAGRFREVFPLRRSWAAIAALLVFDVVFLIPAALTFSETVELWRRPDDLFNLVAALFTTFWLLGWSLAPLAMTTLLAVMLFGREVVTARPGTVEVALGLPLLELALEYDAARMRNLRLEHPPPRSGKSWRGPHIAFDYGANSGAFGSDLGPLEAERIRGRLETATGLALRRGDALPEELQGAWQPAMALTPPAGRTVPPDPADDREELPAVTLASPSTLALVAANLIPLAGAAFGGWNLGMVMVLYWAESAIIGFYNLCKILVIGRWGGLFLGLFFLAHFGGFMAVHFLFIYTLFVEGPLADAATANSLDDVLQMFLGLWPALAVLFLSHGFSFFTNFLGRREYAGKTVKDQMSEPYSRIVFMHLVIIFGGGLTLFLGEPTAVLMIVIGVKILVDVRAHLKQRRPRSTTATKT